VGTLVPYHINKKKLSSSEYMAQGRKGRKKKKKERSDGKLPADVYSLVELQKRAYNN